MTIQTAMDLHRQGRLQEAEVLYRSVLAASPGQFEALHLLGTLKLQQGNLPEALTLISRALDINPSSLDTRSNLVAVLLNLGRPAEAIEHCNQILAVNPAEAGAHYNRSVALAQLARHDEALASFNKVLSIQPGHINALFSRAGVLASLRRYDDAIADFDRLLALVPRHADALNNRGNVLAKLGRDTEAIASFEGALAIAPDHVNALTNRGIALKRRTRHGEALASLDRALALKPDHVEAHVNRGNVLLDLHRPEDAMACFTRALALAPAQAEALTNRAIALRALGRYQDALQSCEQALASEPRYDNALLVRGHTLAKLDRPAEAAASYEQALAINPSNQFALGASLMSHRAACNWERVEQLLPAIERAINVGEAVIPPFNLLGLPFSPATLLQCARNFVRQRQPAEPTLVSRRERAHSDKIRLAYVSGDFHRHPVAYLVADLLERHDRARFEVIGVSLGPDDRSDIRARIVRSFDRFYDARAFGDREIASRLRELDLDIAIDLTGHTENSRANILASRPAPVQVSFLGLIGTMGAEFIDYVIADEIALPFDQQPFFSEKIVHLPDCFIPTDQASMITPRTPTRMEVGLPPTGFVFCSFNASYKIREPAFSAWMRLLHAIEGSVLWLLRDSDDAVANLRREAEIRGVAPDRLVFAPRLELADHLARQPLADLFLDTILYNAGATGIAALWAGVPLLTCKGDAFVGRMAASMLCSVGLPDLVTGTIEEYEALALKLAGDPDLLAATRLTLARNRLTHPLFDTDRFRRYIERAYETMLDIARQGEAPRSFSVEA